MKVFVPYRKPVLDIYKSLFHTGHIILENYVECIIGGILVLFIYTTILASNEIFSPSNKIYREVGWAKDLLAPRYNPDCLKTDYNIILTLHYYF
jgi:hypothetical protein